VCFAKESNQGVTKYVKQTVNFVILAASGKNPNWQSLENCFKVFGPNLDQILHYKSDSLMKNVNILLIFLKTRGF
jgi:hypothetical protein